MTKSEIPTFAEAMAGRRNQNSVLDFSADQRGLSLLGVLVALLLLSVGTLAVVQLLVRNEVAAGLSREQFVATALAREGLELARAQRDTNWFVIRQDPDGISTPDSWAAGLCEPGDGVVERTIGADAFGIIVQDASLAQLWLTSDGRYTHQQRAGSTATPYQRTITIDCGQHDPLGIREPVADDGGTELSAEQQQRILEYLDVDASGVVTSDERTAQLVALIAALRLGVQDESVATFDFSGDGQFTVRDIVLVIGLIRTLTDESGNITVSDTDGAVTVPTISGSLGAAEATYITVTSHVAWESRGQAREVTLTTRLYDWLRTIEL